MLRNHPSYKKRLTRCTRRRGAATIWVIVASPAMLAMLILVSDISNLWLARVELENAVEAAALAGADAWGGGGDTAINRTIAHDRAQALAEANLVRFNAFIIDANDNPSNTNNNAFLPGSVMLGAYNPATSTFDASQMNPAADGLACFVSVTVPVNSLWIGFAGPFNVSATAIARYDSSSGTAKLVYIDPTDDPTMAP